MPVVAGLAHAGGAFGSKPCTLLLSVLCQGSGPCKYFFSILSQLSYARYRIGINVDMMKLVNGQKLIVLRCVCPLSLLLLDLF